MDTISNIRQVAQNYISSTPEKTAPAATEPVETVDLKIQESKARQEEITSAEETAADGVYGNILDISEDGDTVSARPEALAALEDGIVMLKSEPVIEDTSDKAGTESVKASAEQKTFAGISDSQMRTMYLKGDISSATYRREIERRERIEEQINPDKDAATNDIQNRNSEFVDTMSAINASATSNTTENAAYEEASKAGRTDIVMDIFNQGV